ncbi:MAG: hypothetical protein HYV02_06260 [Deltaproteobacteria bacterium]|nr:hypothetical protein [Deltaproteobacteria bacterium]
MHDPTSTTPPGTPQPQGPSGRAVTTLILGILSLMPCLLCVTGIPAIIFGRSEMAAIRRGEASRDGEVLARIGTTLGIIGSAFGGIVLIIWTGLILLGLLVHGL